VGSPAYKTLNTFYFWWTPVKFVVAFFFTGLVWWFVRSNYKGPNEQRRRAINHQMTANLLVLVGGVDGAAAPSSYSHLFARFLNILFYFIIFFIIDIF
jgi:hypothetical protein